MDNQGGLGGSVNNDAGLPGLHPVFSAGDHSGSTFGDETSYFPRDDGDLADTENRPTTYHGGLTDEFRSERWNFPALRSNIRTDTVYAILNLYDGKIDVATYGSSTPDGGSMTGHAAGTGPWNPSDTHFIGDMGCGTTVDAASTFIGRTFFPSVAVLGGAYLRRHSPHL